MTITLYVLAQRRPCKACICAWYGPNIQYFGGSPMGAPLKFLKTNLKFLKIKNSQIRYRFYSLKMIPCRMPLESSRNVKDGWGYIYT